jgi:hypothetical protein
MREDMNEEIIERPLRDKYGDNRAIRRRNDYEGPAFLGNRAYHSNRSLEWDRTSNSAHRWMSLAVDRLGSVDICSLPIVVAQLPHPSLSRCGWSQAAIRSQTSSNGRPASTWRCVIEVRLCSNLTALARRHRACWSPALAGDAWYSTFTPRLLQEVIKATYARLTRERPPK